MKRCTDPQREKVCAANKLAAHMALPEHFERGSRADTLLLPELGLIVDLDGHEMDLSIVAVVYGEHLEAAVDRACRRGRSPERDDQDLVMVLEELRTSLDENRGKSGHGRVYHAF